MNGQTFYNTQALLYFHQGERRLTFDQTKHIW